VKESLEEDNFNTVRRTSGFAVFSA